MKTLNKILPNQVHEHMKKSIQHDQVNVIPVTQGWLNIYKSIDITIKRLKDKNHIIVSSDEG